MRYRKLRIAWSVGCGIACVLLILLWVRSYWCEEAVLGVRESYRWAIESRYGVLQCYVAKGGNTLRQSWNYYSISDEKHGNAFRPTSFRWYYDPADVSDLSVPHWLPAIVFYALAALPWLQWRFTTRTLLIATTLVAVVLGLVVAVLRWPAG